MKHFYLTLGLSLLLGAIALPTSAQVSNDNEDEVYKVDQRFARDFVPGQVLVKMKDGNPAVVQRVKGKFRSAGISKLDAVLTRFEAEEMEQLLPNAKVGKTPRRAKAYNGETIVERDLTQLYKVTLSPEKAHQALQLVDELKALDEVEFAEPNYKAYIMADEHIADSYSGNPFVSQQWYLDNYGVKELWNKPIVNPKRPVIAIIDTGVDLTHPDLVDNLWTNTAEAEGEEGYDNDGNGFKGDVHGWDFINNTGNIRDFNMHGTHVAGIAAAANNGIGIVGANPQALIMAVSVMQSDGTGDMATIIKGIDYAVANGATVLNMSLGSYANSNALRQVLERAYLKTVIVAAAGNNGLPVEVECGNPAAPAFPAGYSFVLGVQATGPSGALAEFSNYDCNGPNYSGFSSWQDPDGYNYELQAPGTDILSTIPGGKYKVLNGTSMAAPLAAGAISALLMVKDYTKDEGLIHQEILWGDLTHSFNIAGAYAITDRPAELDILRIQMRERKDLADETEADYGGDHEIDAGELVSLYPVIRTTFGEASNIKMHLEMGDEFEDASTVEFQTGVVDFGMNLDAYGRGVSQNPLVLKVANNVEDNRHIKLKIVVTCDGTDEVVEKLFRIVVTNMIKINGLISENTTLTADHTYLVNENLGVMKGVTLTIEPGTRLEFKEDAKLQSFGKLVANGTPKNPIVFTKHVSAIDGWGGIISHTSEDKIMGESSYLYTNEEHTLFTLLPTEQTPIRYYSYTYNYFYTKPGETVRSFYLGDYADIYISMIPDVRNRDFTNCQQLLTDPNFLTPAVTKLLADYQAYISQFPTEPTAQETVSASSSANFSYSWSVYDNPQDDISYCKIDGFSSFSGYTIPYMRDCDVNFMDSWCGYGSFEGERNVIHDISHLQGGNLSSNLRYTNIVNNDLGNYVRYLPKYSDIYLNNYFNNTAIYDGSGKYHNKEYWFGYHVNSPQIDKSDHPSYLGTGSEEIVRQYIWELGNAPDTWAQIDLSNMRTTPITEAHGIVWKVLVDGKDARDEYDELPPLGVGKHKFEVYFNRPMNKAVIPQIAFGVRDPFTQNPVSEDASWNDEGTVYTAYKTITGKTKTDGVNRIYVWGAEDDEFFECPYEKTRFNIQVQAAGSMATGFEAKAGMGKVSLTWNNEQNDFADAMGFNIYRYGDAYEQQIYQPHWDENGNYHDYKTILVVDTVRLNTEIVDIETTSYTDYDVTPGKNYYYYYKVLSTDLQEYDVSNVVAATPLTATMGDVNGSGFVDVADVITTVNKITGMEPKPFIFEAADMNTDQVIDVLDVIGIIQKILNPAGSRNAAIGSAAIYTIEDGTLYVESPVDLAGIQVQLAIDNRQTIKAADSLNGFEQVSAWLSDNDYLFLAYSMNGKTLKAGKHALLTIGDGRVASMRLSDAFGQNIMAVGDDETTGIDRMGSDVMSIEGVYDLQGRKLSTIHHPLSTFKKGVYIINGQKVVK